MLETFFQTHDYLVEHAKMPIRRQLIDEIDWEDRLIAIKGGRGVGKTDFLLTRAGEIDAEFTRSLESLSEAKRRKSQQRRPCLYVNLNNFYFTDHTLVEFAGVFVRQGGKYLLLDQMFKYPNWSRELRKCHDRYKDLHIVFAASPVMRLVDENRDIASIVKVHNLRGYSFREYLSLRTGREFKTYTLDEIMRSHCSLSHDICERVNPLPYFQEYLRAGYFPSYFEHNDYQTEMLRMVNMMLDVDILLIRQIDVACLPKIRKLLYIMLNTAPCPLNISSVSDEIEMSRATTLNYIKYLQDARLLNLLYMEGKTFPMKPAKVYIQNPNIAYINNMRQMTLQDLYETFFYHALHADHRVNATERNAMFVVDGKYYFDVKESCPAKESIRPCAVGGLDRGRGNFIPLWLLGFLY